MSPGWKREMGRDEEGRERRREEGGSGGREGDREGMAKKMRNI